MHDLKEQKSYKAMAKSLQEAVQRAQERKPTLQAKLQVARQAMEGMCATLVESF